MTDAACPVCGKALAAEHHDPGAELLVCPAAHGALLTREAAARLPRDLTTALADARRSARPGTRTCPRCAATMDLVEVRRSRGNIDLDVCPACDSTWFDSGEWARTHGPGAASPSARPAAHDARAHAATEGFWHFVHAILTFP